MSSDAKTMETQRAELTALADHLDARRDAILQRWREGTERQPESTIAATLTQIQFTDHIPGVLDAYANTLRRWPAAESAAAHQTEKDQVKGHGLQRWQQGYELRELTREWGQLQLSVMDELESYANARPDIAEGALTTARRAWARLCWDGVSTSTTQYWRLHQAEAAGHVRDLEQALTTLGELERARASVWREAAHDLRGSVSVVKGATSVLDSNVPDAVRAKFFDMLQRGVSSLHEMLNELVSLARLEAGQEQRSVAPFDAAVTMTNFCTTSLPLAEQAGLFLKMEGPDSLPVEGDRTKVTRILQNLLLNAIKYTARGGITVIWGPLEESGGKSWMFCVQDTGPGLAAGPGAPLARQIYKATQVAHEADDSNAHEDAETIANAPTVAAQSVPLPEHQQPGEGVGLSIVKRLCELLDASLELETSAGEGSTFRVTLPRFYQ